MRESTWDFSPRIIPWKKRGEIIKERKKENYILFSYFQLISWWVYHNISVVAHWMHGQIMHPMSTHITCFWLNHGQINLKKKSVSSQRHMLLCQETCFSILYFYVFPIYLMVVPPKSCSVGTSWMQNLTMHPTSYYTWHFCFEVHFLLQNFSNVSQRSILARENTSGMHRLFKEGLWVILRSNELSRDVCGLYWWRTGTS